MDYPELIVDTRKGLRFLKSIEIVTCKADGNYTTIQLQCGERILISKKLKELENILSKDHFFRIHHSHLINLYHLKTMKNGTDMKVQLSDGQELDISKRKRGAFMKLFKKL